MSETSSQAGRRRRHDDRGASLVEFALILPLLAMLVTGLFSSAMLYDGKMQLTHAAREGARYGAAVPDDEIFASGTWAENVRRLVIQREGGRLTEADVCVALVTGNPATAVHTTNGGVCFDDAGSGEANMRVQVSATRTTRFDAVAFSRDVTTTARASARFEFNG